MIVLVAGDIVGRPGRRALNEALPALIAEHKPDFVIANGENAAGGAGITRETAAPLFAADVRRYVDAHFGDRDASRFIALLGDAAGPGQLLQQRFGLARPEVLGQIGKHLGSLLAEVREALGVARKGLAQVQRTPLCIEMGLQTGPFGGLITTLHRGILGSGEGSFRAQECNLITFHQRYIHKELPNIHVTRLQFFVLFLRKCP